MSKLVVGTLSDALAHKFPRVSILLVFNSIQTIVLTVSIGLSNHLSVLLTVNIILGASNGALWCLTPAMVSEYYELKYFGRNWGSVMSGNAVGTLLLQEIYGWLYDSSIKFGDQKDCYCVHCFWLIFCRGYSFFFVFVHI